MYDTYIIQSQTTKKYYIGSTQNIEKRLIQHNNGKTKSIKNKGPFVVIYHEAYDTKEKEYARERQIKSYKGGNAFKKLIKAS